MMSDAEIDQMHKQASTVGVSLKDKLWLNVNWWSFLFSSFLQRYGSIVGFVVCSSLFVMFANIAYKVYVVTVALLGLVSFSLSLCFMLCLGVAVVGACLFFVFSAVFLDLVLCMVRRCEGLWFKNEC